MLQRSNSEDSRIATAFLFGRSASAEFPELSCCTTLHITILLSYILTAAGCTLVTSKVI